MPSQHEKFIRLRELVRQKAERMGDRTLAEGLAQCIQNAVRDGGDFNCPIGQLIKEDYIQTGKLPSGWLLSPAPSPPTAPSRSAGPSSPERRHQWIRRLLRLMRQEDIPVYSCPAEPSSPQLRQQWIGRLHELMKQDALWHRDERYVRALQQCEDFMQSNPDCPLHKLLSAD
jgi:hypothetical protein